VCPPLVFVICEDVDDAAAIYSRDGAVRILERTSAV